MKIRTGLVSNSSSSSYVIRPNAKDKPVWPIFITAARLSPEIDVDLERGKIEDRYDNSISDLCYELGIDPYSILEVVDFRG